MNFKKICFMGLASLALSGGLFFAGQSQVNAASGSKLLQVAEKSIGKYSYRTHYTNRVSSAVIKKYHLKEATIPKRFRGIYYSYTGYSPKVVIGKHHISWIDGKIYQWHKSYQKSFKNYDHPDALLKSQVTFMRIDNHGKDLDLPMTQGQGTGFWLRKIHGHKAVLNGSGRLWPFYTSKKLARKYAAVDRKTGYR